MSSSDEEARGTAGNLSPATKPRKDRVRLELHLLDTEDSGSDDHLSSERRGTPRDATEGRDQDHSTRSDHSDPHHKSQLPLWRSHLSLATCLQLLAGSLSLPQAH